MWSIKNYFLNFCICKYLETIIETKDQVDIVNSDNKKSDSMSNSKAERMQSDQKARNHRHAIKTLQKEKKERLYARLKKLKQKKY